MLSINNISKHYGDHLVFDALTYQFLPGCFVLNDEENTGKSTLLGIVAGVITPDTGDILVEGSSLIAAPVQTKSRIAYVPDDCFALPALTGQEMLERVAQEKNVPLDDEALEFAADLGLEPHLNKRFEQMSTGTRRKVYLVAAGIGNPAVIVADGPSNGLDTPARTALAATFRVWSRDRVVLFASHDAALNEGCEAISLSIADLRS